MKRLTKAQQRRINDLLADTAAAQQRAATAIAAELERRQEPPFEWPAFEWDPAVLEALAEPIDLHFEEVDLSGLFEDVDLSNLLGELRPVYIPIEAAPQPRQRRRRSRRA